MTDQSGFAPQSAPLTTGGEFRRGWPTLLASLFGFGLGLSALTFYANQVFIPELSKEFGWTGSQIQAGILAMPIATIFLAPVIGSIVDRFGARRVVLVSIFLYALSVASFYVLTPSLWQYYAHWGVMSVVGLGTIAITWTRTVAGWFDKGRGIALGVALMGTGLAGAFIPRFTTWAIEGYGWREAYVMLAAFPMLIALPLVFFLFRDPPKQLVGQTAVELPGMSGGEALKSGHFWLMWVAFFFISVGVGALIPNMVPILMADGVTRANAASLAGLIGLSVIAGRLVCGLLIDRIWAPAIAFVFLAVPAVSCLVLAHPEFGSQYLALAAILVGLAAGAEFDLIAFMVSRYFGMKNYAKIYAWQFIGFGIGSGFMAPVPSLVKERMGSYDPALYVIAALFVLGAFMLLFMGRYRYAASHGA
jgi:MFS family permease